MDWGVFYFSSAQELKDSMSRWVGDTYGLSQGNYSSVDSADVWV